MGCFDCDSARIHDEVCTPKKRTCTDVLCLTLFGLFWAGFIAIAAFAFFVGDPLRLVQGTDSFGNVCGRKNIPIDRIPYSGMDLRDKRYVFFMDANNPKQGLKICVSACPNVSTITDQAGMSLYYQKTGNNLCRYDYDFASPRAGEDYSRADQDGRKGLGPCPAYPVPPSRPILNRCIPTNLIGAIKSLGGGLYEYFHSFDTFKQIVGDIMVSWREILIMSLASVLITLVVVFLIHFVASLVAWFLLIIVSVAMILLTGVLWYTYVDLRFKLNDELIKYTNVVPETWRNQTAFLVMAIISTIATVILCLICLVMRKRVKLVVALFDESAHCIRAMPGLLFQPVWTFLVLATFIIFWIFVVLAMATANYGDRTDQPLSFKTRRPSVVTSNGDLTYGQSDVSTLTSVNYNKPSWVRYMWWYAIIAFLWNCEFILGCQQLVIAGAVSSWYFCRDRSNLPCPVGRSIRRLFCYHMGTVALGSFLIMLLQIPRIILAYVTEKLKSYEDWQVVKGILYCCSCCLWVLEKFLQYLTRNAYSVTAYKGTAYCSSARIAFTTIASNALRVATINSVGDFILFLGKCTVTAITAIAATLLLKVRFPHTADEAFLMTNDTMSNSSSTTPSPLSPSLSSYDPSDPQQNMDQLNFYAVPLVLISIFAFFIAHCVLSVYEVSSECMFFVIVRIFAFCYFSCSCLRDHHTHSHTPFFFAVLFSVLLHCTFPACLHHSRKQQNPLVNLVTADGDRHAVHVLL